MKRFLIFNQHSGTQINDAWGDYITRDAISPNTIRFWQRGKRWWNRNRMVGAIENSSGSWIIVTDCKEVADAEFLKIVGVKP